MRKIKHPAVHVGLSGEDGSAYVILGRVTKALRLAGLDDEIDAFMGEATSGDYDHMLRTVMRTVNTTGDHGDGEPAREEIERRGGGTALC